MAKMLISGGEFGFPRDLEEVLDNARRDSLEFVVIPLFHPRNRRDSLLSERRNGPQTRSDMVLSSSEWISNIVGKISEVNPCIF